MVEHSASSATADDADLELYTIMSADDVEDEDKEVEENEPLMSMSIRVC